MSNLMAVTRVRFMAIPVQVFLRAIEGVSTAAIRLLHSRARIASHKHPEVQNAERPCTAVGVDDERSFTREWSR